MLLIKADFLLVDAETLVKLNLLKSHDFWNVLSNLIGLIPQQPNPIMGNGCR
jgi:hypothetical protein